MYLFFENFMHVCMIILHCLSSPALWRLVFDAFAHPSSSCFPESRLLLQCGTVPFSSHTAQPQRLLAALLRELHDIPLLSVLRAPTWTFPPSSDWSLFYPAEHPAAFASSLLSHPHPPPRLPHLTFIILFSSAYLCLEDTAFKGAFVSIATLWICVFISSPVDWAASMVVGRVSS